MGSSSRFLACSSLGLALVSCGITGGSGAVADGGGGSDGSSHRDAGKSDGGTKHSDAPTGMSCPAGEACGDAGTCVDNQCCAASQVCNGACCSSSTLCSFGKCVMPGASCVDSTSCSATEYCQYSLATAATGDAGRHDAGPASPDAALCVGGAAPPTGVCLPLPPICPADAGVPDSGTCIEKCEYHPPPTAFAPVLAYSWGGVVAAPFNTDVMMTPVVLPLEDTNCDGKINSEDIPDIVFTSFSNGSYSAGGGVVHALSVRNGALVERWSAMANLDPSAHLAAGNIDGKPGNEIVGCMGGVASRVGVVALNGDGSPLWTNAAASCFMPAIGDLDGDGTVEVVVEGGILDGATGVLKASFDGTAGTVINNFALSDLDGDGKLDIISAAGAYHSDGTRFVTIGPDTTNANDFTANFVAVGDLDKDGKPEVVAVDFGAHTVSIWDYDATAMGGFTYMRQAIDINGTLVQHCPMGSFGTIAGGGPPTVADFNGDGVPDVALAGGIGYTIFDGSKIIDMTVPITGLALWADLTTDCSSAETGSSVFDFTGDGKAEALYSDEEHLRVYDGPTGNVLWSTCNTTGTIQENPIVVDVDNDGHADIVVVSNASFISLGAEFQCQDVDAGPIAQSGVRVFSDSNLAWVRTRSIWNQHTYHVTNVNDDGTIPQNELSNWTQSGLNDFRQNKQPGSEFAAPDGIVSVVPSCGSPFSVIVTVRNIGEAALPAGVVIGIHAGTAPNGMQIAKATTQIPLYAAQSEAIVVPIPNAPANVKTGMEPVYAVFDDTTVPHPSWHECNTTNNTSAGAEPNCGVPK